MRGPSTGTQLPQIPIDDNFFKADTFGLSSMIYILCAHLDILLGDTTLALAGVLNHNVRVPSTLGLQLQEFLYQQIR
jgi:hypothetical protein